MKIKNIINLIKGELLSGSYEDEISHIQQDSREIKRGDTFIAFVGEDVDGNKFIYDAIEKGAKTCIVTTKDIKPVKANIIYVENTFETLDILMEYKLSLAEPLVIAITGSVGKTTTRDIMATILSEKFKVFKSEKNFNERRGLPLNAVNMPVNTEVAVLEMGMDRLGEISELSSLFRPDYGVITNVGMSHIEKLGSKENVLKAKLEMIDGIKDKGYLVLNTDDESLNRFYEEQKDNLFRNYKMLTYAMNNDDVNLIGKLIQIEEDGMSVTFKYGEHIFKVNTNLIGKHNIYNMLPGILIALRLGLTEKEIQTGLEKVLLSERRLEKFTVNKMTVYDDTYNASLESMKAGIEILRREDGRKVAILGDVFELGEFSEEVHREIGKFLNEVKLDLVITGGKASRFINDELIEIDNYHFETTEEIVENVSELLKVGDVILIKASNGMKFNLIANKLREEEKNIPLEEDTN